MTTIDEVIYCGTVWLEAESHFAKAGDMFVDKTRKANRLLDLCFERYTKALAEYEAQQAFEDKLEAQIAEEVAELMGDKV